MRQSGGQINLPAACISKLLREIYFVACAYLTQVMFPLGEIRAIRYFVVSDSRRLKLQVTDTGATRPGKKTIWAIGVVEGSSCKVRPCKIYHP